MDEVMNQDGLVLSTAYADTMDHLVLPYLKARQKDSTVSGADQKPLFCSQYIADHPEVDIERLHLGDVVLTAVSVVETACELFGTCRD